MRVPLSWLREYVDIDLPVPQVTELLTNAGLEVESIEYVGLPGAELEWDRERIVLGQVLKVEQHPDADRLVLATVAYGAAEPKVAVTGAPNLFPYIGRGDLSAERLYAPYALEGVTLYDGHKEGRVKARLKGRPLRGIYNDSMLCSEKELGISEEHEGIILMQDAGRGGFETRPYEPGTPLQDVLGDAVLEIAILPSTARATSILGVARELAALTGKTLRYPDTDVVMEGPPVEGRVVITTDEPALNPRFVALVIEGVRQTPSPYWMQHRLRLAGQRPINVVVDISNYVMLEIGQPNHTFDYDVLRRRADSYAPDGPIHIHTRLPHLGETLTTLDGAVHKLEPYTILVTDPAGNLSVGGIMGGLESEIKDDTTNVLLEAAAWNFINIRRSANALDLHTEAAYRFSRGVHPSLALMGAKRAAELMRRLAGGVVAQGIVDYYPNPAEPVVVDLDPVYARKLSGLDLPAETMAALLERLEFTVEPRGDQLRVTAPDHRLDIEGPHDLVEEICRLYGYDRIPSTRLADELPPQRGNAELDGEERVRDLLVDLGLQEIWSYRLTSPDREARLLPAGPPDGRPYVALLNPPAPDRHVMRHSILSSVLEATAANSRHAERIALFEIGEVYLAGEEEPLPDELTRLALVLTGRRAASGWNNGAAGTYDFFDLKGVLDAFFEALHVPVTVEAAAHPTYRPGRSARLLVGERQIGIMGELHPGVVKGFDLRIERNQPVLAADIDLEALLPLVPDKYPYVPVSTYPPVREDLALVVDAGLPAANVEAALRQYGGALLREVALFDVYEGNQLPPGKKSLAYHLAFQAPDKTLTDKDVSRQRGRLLKLLEQQLGAKLRE
ncbi:phenylalanine--tRNA ligase subunit beta [Promineifilum sp.]|uniref:phenylalanine--tRNA ligase subunit beta n=1 Tax=Promineifilum sp. TaxID=2664178 RepID=UPI0035ADA8F0